MRKLVYLTSALWWMLWAGAAQAGPIRVSYPSPSANYLALIVGVQKGIYPQHGIEVEAVRIRTATTAAQALIAGNITFSLGGPSAGLLAINKGAPLVMVMGLINTPQYHVYGIPEVKSLRDLKGKRVGSGAAGGMPDFVMRTALRSAGLTPADVQLQAIAGEENRFVALESKVIVANAFTPPSSFRAEKMGFRKLAALKDLVKDYQGDLVYAHKELLHNNPDVVEKFVKATLQTIQYMKKNKAETVGVLMDFTKVDRDLAELTYDDMVPVMPDDGSINVKGVEAMQEYFRSVGVQTGETPPPSQYIVTRFIGKGSK